MREDVDPVAAEADFSGVVRVDRDGVVELDLAYGRADRGHDIACTLDTRFAIASGAKGYTALTVMALVEEGLLRLDTPARELLADDLALIDDAVTVEHLLAHRSGIGDYLDEDAHPDPNDYVMPVPVQNLAATKDYLAILDGFPQRRPPDEVFEYCNGGYVVLAVLAERASGIAFHELVEQRVCRPAASPARASCAPTSCRATSRWATSRWTAWCAPTCCTSPGAAPATAASPRRSTTCPRSGARSDAGVIVPPAVVSEMTRVRSVPDERADGLGFWLHPARDIVSLEGYDAGVSLRSVHEGDRRLGHTVIGNTTDGAWPMSRLLGDALTTH